MLSREWPCWNVKFGSAFEPRGEEGVTRISIEGMTRGQEFSCDVADYRPVAGKVRIYSRPLTVIIRTLWSWVRTPQWAVLYINRNTREQKCSQVTPISDDS